MPKIQKSIADLDQTLWRPMIVGLLEELKSFTDLWKETVRFFPGDSKKTFQAGSSLDSTSVTDTVRGEAYSQVAIEATEDYEHDGFLNTPVEHPEHLFIFQDRQLGIFIKPAYSSVDVTVALKYRAWDKNSGEQWRQQLKARIARGRLVNLHTITYGYIIPESMMYILRELHQLRENVAGYGEDFDTYFKRQATEHATLATNLAGRNAVWMVGESANRIQGYFDFDGAPEKGAKDEEGNETWITSVNYKFRYYKPEVCWMEYPLMVHNQLLPQNIRPAHGPYEIEKQERAYQWSTKALSHFEKGVPAQQNRQQALGLRLPSLDEFVVNQGVPQTFPLFTMLISLDETNIRQLADLTKDLYPYKLDPDVQTFLASEAVYVNVAYGSIFQLTLYDFDQQRDLSMLTLDENLIVRSTEDLSLRRMYHLRLAIVINLDLLPPRAIKGVQSHCTAATKLFDTIDPKLTQRGCMPSCLMPGDWLPAAGLAQVKSCLNKPTPGNTATGPGWGNMRTVQQSTIQVYRPGSLPKQKR